MRARHRELVEKVKRIAGDLLDRIGPGVTVE